LGSQLPYPRFLAATIGNLALLISLLALCLSICTLLFGVLALFFGDLPLVPRKNRRCNHCKDSDRQYYCQSAKAAGSPGLIVSISTLSLQLPLALRFAFLCGTLALRSFLCPQCDAGLQKLPLHRIDGRTVRLCPDLRFFELRATQ